jgi:hypothetical protein
MQNGDLEDGRAEKTEMDPFLITDISVASKSNDGNECVNLVIVSKDVATETAAEGVGTIEECENQQCSFMRKPWLAKPEERLVMVFALLFASSIYLTLYPNNKICIFLVIVMAINFAATLFWTFMTHLAATAAK